VRKHTQTPADVELPDDVRRGLVLEELVTVRAVVLAVEEALRVERAELALRSDVVQPLSFDLRRAGR
jgi:hypothetical protein